MDDLSEIRGFIGEGTSLDGVLRFEGTFRIDGRVTGTVSSTALLIVGPPGLVDVDTLEVGSLSVSGSVRGRLHVRDKLEIHAGGSVVGEVTLSRPGLLVHPGGHFDGPVHMSGDDASAALP